MAEFILIQTIINLFLALVWSKTSWMNLTIKVIFIIMLVTGTYLLFGPSNMIAALSK